MQVRAALNYGYKEAIKNGIVTGYYSFEYQGGIVTIYIENGVFKTGYGNYIFEYEKLFKLLPRGWEMIKIKWIITDNIREVSLEEFNSEWNWIYGYFEMSVNDKIIGFYPNRKLFANEEGNVYIGCLN